MRNSGDQVAPTPGQWSSRHEVWPGNGIGEEVSKEHLLVTSLHRSRRPVPGLSLQGTGPSFPFKRAKVVYTQGGGGRSGLPASRHPPPRGRVREGGAGTQPAYCRETDQQTLARRPAGGPWGPEAAKERDTKLGERSDLGAGGGVVSGGGERQRQLQPEERAGPGSQSAAHPSGANRAGKQAGPGAASLDPHGDPSAPQPGLKMMKRQLHRMRQLAHTGSLGRTPETAEFLGEDLLQVEQRLEPAKRAAHNVHKRLQACLQGQSGADMDKRVKKLPLMALSTTMAESFKELDPDSSMGKALEMSCAIQNQLARILAEFEMTLERDVLQPLSRLSEEELPAILKHKKSLQKLVSDWNTLKSRLSQAAKNSGSSQGLGGGPSSHSHATTATKVDTLKEEEEELKRKVEQCKDEYLADLYHFATKEDSYANYFIHLLEIQADYHRRSLTSLDTALAELRDNHSQADLSPLMTAAPVSRVYGVPLRTHLQELGRDIALPIEACVLMLLSEGMQEEGLFRLAAGASVLKRLKQTMASDPHSLEEFCSDPHAVAGALKSYLRELPEPLMTSDLYDDWMRAASLKEPGARLEALRDVCSRLPQENLNNLRYLMKFLALLAEEHQVNKMTPSNIAIVLGPNLLWPPEKEGDQAQLDAASVSSIQVVGVVEALVQNADTLFPGDINFSVSGVFSALAPQDKASSQRTSEDLPPAAAPTPAATPAPASTAVKERTESEVPKPASPKVSRSPMETATSAEDMTRRTKRPAPARPTMPPPQPSSTRSSPPAPPLPPGPGIPGAPQALPRRLVGTSLRAPTVPPPLPPVPPQPARRQSRRLPASPSPASPGLVVSNSPAQADQAAATEDRGGPEALGGHPTPPVLPPQPRPRGLTSETD